MSAEESNIRRAVPWAVMFPEVEPPDAFKVDCPDEGNNFFPLVSAAQKPAYTPTGEVISTLSGMSQVQQNVPVFLSLEEDAINFILPIMGTKIHQGKKIVIANIGRDEDDEAARMWIGELLHPTVSWHGGGAIQVIYKEFNTFMFRAKGGTIPGGFNEYTQKIKS
jgi:hypothetical protein